MPNFGHKQLNHSPEVDQEDTQSCYLQTVKQLLEGYLNKHKQKERYDLARLSLLAGMKNGPNTDSWALEFSPANPLQDRGGNASHIIDTLRNQNFPIRLATHSELRMDQLSEKLDATCNQNASLKKDFRRAVLDLEEVFAKIDPRHILLSDFPPFNIYDFSGKTESSLSNLEVINSNIPVGFWIDSHIVTITGSATVCCGTECKQRFLIRNSSHHHPGGWFSSKKILDALGEKGGGITLMKECTTEPQHNASLDRCQAGILNFPYLQVPSLVAEALKELESGKDNETNRQRNRYIGLEIAEKNGDLHLIRNLITHFSGNTKELLQTTLDGGYDSVFKATLNLAFANSKTDDLTDSPKERSKILNELMTMAIQKGKSDLLSSILKAGADLLSMDPPAFFIANEKTIPTLKALGANVDSRNERGQTALIYLVGILAYPSTIKGLIAAGADVNAQDHKGNTALHNASDTEAVNAILEAHPQLELTNSEGETPFLAAARTLDQAKVEALIKAGANLDARDKAGNNALDLLHEMAERNLRYSSDSIKQVETIINQAKK